MIKVLIIGMTSILGGVETYIYNLIKNIDRKKYQFDFLVIGSEPSVFEKEINAICGGENRFYYCPNIKNDFFKTLIWLKKFYDERRYDLIYLNTCTTAKIVYCKYAVDRYNTKLISHSHNGAGNSNVTNNLFKRIITKSSVVHLACSDVAGNWLFGKYTNDVLIIPNGVQIERFQYNDTVRYKIREKLDISSDKIVIGHVGRFSYQKNHEFFLKLASILGGNDFIFLLIGEGEMKNEFEKKLQQENLKDYFRILPSQENIENYYSAMDVFAMPSHYEGLPIVAVEAQANGLPCIFSTRISRQIDLTHKNAFCSIDNVKEWLSIIEKGTLMRYDGTNLLKKAGFDLQDVVNDIEKIFDKVIMEN